MKKPNGLRSYKTRDRQGRTKHVGNRQLVINESRTERRQPTQVPAGRPLKIEPERNRRKHITMNCGYTVEGRHSRHAVPGGKATGLQNASMVPRRQLVDHLQRQRPDFTARLPPQNATGPVGATSGNEPSVKVTGKTLTRGRTDQFGLHVFLTGLPKR